MGVDFKTHPGIPLFLEIIYWSFKIPFITYLLISVPILSANTFGYTLLYRDLQVATQLKMGALIIQYIWLKYLIYQKKMQAELFTSDQSESKIWEISEINASIRKLLNRTSTIFG